MCTNRLLLIALWAVLTACRSSSSPAPAPSAAPVASAVLAPNASTIKVWVSANGAMELDGKPSSLQAIEAILPQLTDRPGAAVFYGRDGAGGEPHPDAMKLIKAIVANRLPIRMSAKRDFSDTMNFDAKVYH